MNNFNYPIVVPVIELGLLALPLSKAEENLANQIKERSTQKSYVSTPDGWFVSLNDLRDDVSVVAEFLLHEIDHYGELDIGGGYMIWTSAHKSLGIPFDSTFRFAADLANIVINIQPGEKRNVAVGAQEFWNIYANSNLVDIHIEKKGQNGFIVDMPIIPLRDQFRDAQSLVANFAFNLEKIIFIQNQNKRVISDDLRFMFGLDKVE